MKIPYHRIVHWLVQLGHMTQEQADEPRNVKLADVMVGPESGIAVQLVKQHAVPIASVQLIFRKG